MGVTADQVDVILRAQTAQYQADLKSADKTFTAVAANATRSAAQVNAAASNLNTGNIAAQFQDIGVTAAMGMNPLIIALQQGTQLSAVMNESMQRGVSPAKALGGAFLQILNPISLATIAAVALGAALLQAFSSVLPETIEANEAISKHRQELEGIVSGYSAAEEAVEAYFNVAERLASGIATAQTTEQFAQLEVATESFRQEMERIAGDGLFAKFGSDAIRTMQELAGQFSRGEITAEEFYLALEDTRKELNLLEQAGAAIPGSTAAMISAWQQGALQAIAFGNAINNLVAASHALAGLAGDADLQNILDLDAYLADQERVNAMTAEELALHREIGRIKKEAGEFGITDERAAELAQQTLAAEERRAQIKREMAAGGKAESAAIKELDAVKELIATLEYEQSILGMSAEQQAVANALREAGAAATEQQKARIEELVIATMEEEAAIQRTEEAMRKFQSMATSAITGFIGDLQEGKSAAEALSNMFNNLAEQLIQIAAQNLISAAFGGIFGGGGGGGFLSSIFGGARASGGPVSGGKSYLVGERGPELFTPSSAGSITPNHALGGGAAQVSLTVQASEYFDARVERVAGPVAVRTAASAVGQYDSNLQSRIAEKDARYG